MSQRKSPQSTPTIPGRTPKRPAPQGGPIGKRMPDKRTPIPAPKAPKVPAPKRTPPKGGPIVINKPDKRVPPQTKTTGTAAANAAAVRAAAKLKSARATNLNASVSRRQTPLGRAAAVIKARARG